MLTIKLPEDIEARLCRLAREAGRSEAEYAAEVLIEYLGDLEDLRIAESRLEDIRAGRSRTIPLDEVMRQYGMDD
jgi:RHH-type transcriptional regulator, rel operon repressor / antitoxin RelB